MSTIPEFKFSQAIKAATLRSPFGMVVSQDVSQSTLAETVKRYKLLKLEEIRSTSPAIRGNIEKFDRFFKLQGFSCPLAAQLRSISRRGFPTISPFVDALLICEMSSGVLMGVQDMARLEGGLIFDLANSGECFEGLHGPIMCKPDEIVLRDDETIIASYFQGPDRKTRVTSTTTQPVFFVFSAPGLPEEPFEYALHLTIDLLSSSTRVVERRVFVP